MPRIRTVKPDLFTHELLFEAEKESGLPIRLAFIGLFTCCDRLGKFKWRPRQLKLDILPYDEINFEDVLNKLWESGFIKKYCVDGEFYGVVSKFLQHQTINARESDSTLPDLKNELEIDASVTREPRVSHASQSCTWGREGKGREKEGKGKGREGGVGEIISDDSAPTNLPGVYVSNASLNIQLIFDHWRNVMGKHRTRFNDERGALIKRAMKWGYTCDDLCEAITGCSLTPHNMGDNDRGGVYNGLGVIFKSADQIDRFMHNAKNPPQEKTTKPRTVLEKNQAVLDEILREEAQKKALGRITHVAD